MRSGKRVGKRVVILLAEDDPGDQELTRRALQGDADGADLRVVDDGEEALDYLHHREHYVDPATSPTPDLILLDLNMPKMNGGEVLATLRGNAKLSRIPVVVLTTSQQEADVLRSYDLGCNSFIHKPVDIEHFVDVIRKLRDYWFQVVTLPSTFE